MNKKLIEVKAVAPEKIATYASGGSNWMACPGKPALESFCPRRPAHPSAAEGTRAHSLLEKCIKYGAPPSTYESPTAPKEITKESFVSVQKAYNVVKGFVDSYGDGKVKIEAEKKYSMNILGGYNNAKLDIRLLNPYDTLHIIDYKNGTWPVEAYENYEMLVYLILTAESINYDVNHFKCTIIQPNGKYKGQPIEDIQPTATYTADEVRGYKKKIMSGISKCQEAGVVIGKGYDTPEFKKYLKTGNQCVFCNANTVCPAFTAPVKRASSKSALTSLKKLSKEAKAIKKEKSETGSSSKKIGLTPEYKQQLVELYEMKSIITSAVDEMTAVIRQLVEQGDKDVPYHLEDSIGNRRWLKSLSHEDLLCVFSKANLGDDEVIEKKLRSPNQILKLINKKTKAGKERAALIEGAIERPITGKKLVRDTAEYFKKKEGIKNNLIAAGKGEKKNEGDKIPCN